MKTKKIVNLILVLVFVLVLLPAIPMTASAAETETELTVTIDTGAEVTLVDADADGYYDIGTADELYAFAAAVNGGSRSINGELTADITVNTGVMVNGSLAADTSGFRVWTPIGNSNVAFSGNFNGNDYTVYGLYFYDKSVDYVGLIGRSAGWNTVRNVRVSDSYLYGYGYVGGVVGYSGYGGSITSCYYSGVAKGAGTRVGGVVGNNHCGTITDCGNDAEISAGNTAGGITGYNYNGTILRCYNTGEVYGALDVGGIAGVSSSGGEVRDCYNTGYIYGWNYIGGIVGNNGSSISGCYNTGEILAKDSSAGGIAGDSRNNAAVSSCYNTGNISASDYSCGGIIGYLYGTVVNCYNSGNIETIRNCGGIVGTCTTVTIANCYNSGNTILGNSKGGGISGDDDERAVFIKCYYLTGTARGAVYDRDLAGCAEAWDDFSTGEIAWILRQGVTLSQKTGETDDQGNAIYEDVFYSGELWGQNIDRAEPYDAYPMFSKDVIYAGYTDCFATEVSYSNSVLYETTGHVYENKICTRCGQDCPHESYKNGFCIDCDSYEPAVQSNGVYEIDNTGKLFWFAQMVNTDNENFAAADAVLKADIDLENRNWMPIGSTVDTPYSGVFDGGNHTVSAMNITEGKHLGFIGYMTNGGVKNLAVSGSITADSNSIETVGMVAAYVLDSGLYNCSASGTIAITKGFAQESDDGNVTIYMNMIGGVNGLALHSVLFNCAADVDISYLDVEAPSILYIGGVAGYVSANTLPPICVINCYGTGDIVVTLPGESAVSGGVGGIVGYLEDDAVNNYYNGTITADTAGKVDILVGYAFAAIDSDLTVDNVAYEILVQHNYYPEGNVAVASVTDISDATTSYTPEQFSATTGPDALVNMLNGNLGLLADMVAGHKGVLDASQWAELVERFGGDDCVPFHWTVEAGQPVFCYGQMDGCCCDTCEYDTHIWNDATCIAPKTCTTCGSTEGEALGHSYENGTCTVCGEEVSLFNLAGANLELSNDITMYFYVNASDVADGYYMEIVKTNADGSKVTKKVEKADWTAYGSTMYFVGFNGMAAKEMADEISVTVYNAEGVQVSNSTVTSISSYALRALDSSAYASMHTMMADLLNYGAAAQTFFKYNTSDLANAAMTETHKGYATKGFDMSKYTNDVVVGAGVVGANLSLETNILQNFYFDPAVVDSTMTAKVSYTNYRGVKKTVEIPGSEFGTMAGYGYVIVEVAVLVPADVMSLVSVEIVDANGAVVASVSDSISSYAVRANTSSPNALYVELMEYCLSCEDYFG